MKENRVLIINKTIDFNFLDFHNKLGNALDPAL
jgi:hypothetical protein